MTGPSAAARDPGRWPRSRTGPLAGIRIADFCWLGVGSCATRLLADFGAQVVKIEDRERLDTIRRLPFYKGETRTYGEEESNPDPDRGGLHNNYSRNKLGVTINMRDERGRALALALISKSSVVTENFAPGVMEKWGLTYETLKERVPDVIYGRMSGFGHDGPHANYRSYGPVVQAVCGLSAMAGLPGERPSGWGFSYMDNMAAMYASAALLLAILHRNRTGDGSEVDVAAVDVGVSFLGPVLLDISVNGRQFPDSKFPPGNRIENPRAAPHGVYRSKGSDRWVAIAVTNDEQWKALTAALGAPDWTLDPRFASSAGRYAAQDELDLHVTRWTETRDPFEAMHVLQAAGVPASAVQNPHDLVENDPQLAHRRTFFEMDHPVIGPALFEGHPATMSVTEPDHWRSAPLLGEDNRFVFQELLGLGDDEIAELAASGVI